MNLTIGGVANASGVGVETVRFYEREGLVDRPERPARGHRQYPLSVVGRIRFIRRAQDLGFTLREIRELIALGEATTADCHEVCRLAQGKIDEIDRKVADLSKMRSVLDGLRSSCERRGQVSTCAILESLQSLNATSN